MRQPSTPKPHIRPVAIGKGSRAMALEIENGRTYWVHRGGQRVRGTCVAQTQLQVRMAIEGEDDPVWISWQDVGEEVKEDEEAEPGPRDLLLAAQRLIGQALEMIEDTGRRDAVADAMRTP